MDWRAYLGEWQREARILVLDLQVEARGRQDAGKKTLRRMLEVEGLVQTRDPNPEDPNPVEFSIGNIKFKAYDSGDFGGHQTALTVLKHYNIKVDAVVYLIDAELLSKESMNAELESLLSRAELLSAEECIHAELLFEALRHNIAYLFVWGKLNELLLNELPANVSSRNRNELPAEVPFLILWKNGQGQNASEEDLDFSMGRYRNILDRPVEVFMGCVEGFRWLSQHIN